MTGKHTIIAALVVLSSGAICAAPAKVEFNRDIRPILSDKCFFCHGPDAKKREADLRLDVRSVAVEMKAIVPGDPAKSGIIDRVTTTDADDHMPPAKSKLPVMTAAEIEILKRWIAEGAEYQEHWAFIPLKPVEIPNTNAASPMDAIIVDALAKRDLMQQPEADKQTLIRRVSFDLTGMPPTPQEIEAFVSDAAPDAYEKLVDRLLKSPHYGERMAVDWLDVSRYADSYGFQVDRERDVWPWRDWVVKAFNENLSFDKFSTWQLAGDLLPNPTDEQILATAFNRLHQQEAEGGSVEEEYRVEYVCDRVQTFATAFLGLTFECARCHDHKFDPIAQKEYYQFFSMFQNIDEAGLYSFFTPSPPTPALMMMDAPAKTKMEGLKLKVAGLQAQASGQPESPDFTAWLNTRPKTLAIPGEIGRYSFDALENKNHLANDLNPKQPATLQGENKLVPGHSGRAVEFTGDDPVDLPFGNFKRHEPFSVSLWMKTPDVKDRAVVFHRSKAWTDAASRGYELLIEDGKLKWSLIHFWPGNAISIRAKDLLAVNQWTHVVVTSDGSASAAGLKMYVNGKPASIDVIKDNLTKDITGGGGDNIALGERFRDRGFKGGVIDDFRVFERELSGLEALATHDATAANDLLGKPLGQLSKDERQMLNEYFRAALDADLQKKLADLKAARAELTSLSDGINEIMVMRELPQPKKAYVLLRGQYVEHRDEVHGGTPAALPPMPAGAPMNRLGLARWLTSPNHPLTARVTVNRFWQGLFGRGLVKTAEDFGSQGARPLYPEVLDWLALRFIQSGWDTKVIMKTMVMSQTYRQRSIADVAIMTDDPDNEWLARGPRFRLPAEMIRDNALAAAGLLAPVIGGAPVNPYEMSEAFKPEKPSGGNGVYRRSLYTNWRRTGPPPAMIAFDAPRRAVCAAKRERTDSPLQALILLNGTQYVEAARVLGEKLHQESKGDLNAMIEQGFMRCLGRKPDAQETHIVQQLYREQLEHFKSKPADAAALLKPGNTKHDEGIPEPEAAAATVLAQALLNHDACVVKR